MTLGKTSLEGLQKCLYAGKNPEFMRLGHLNCDARYIFEALKKKQDMKEVGKNNLGSGLNSCEYKQL